MKKKDLVKLIVKKSIISVLSLGFGALLVYNATVVKPRHEAKNHNRGARR